MSQWGQPQQPGFQYPMQTGFPANNPQFQQPGGQFQPQNNQFQPQNQQFPQQQQQQGGFGGPGLVPQQTGFLGQRMQSFQQPQQTGFQAGQGGFIQSQPTGYVGQNNFQNQGRPAPPPVPPLPTQFAGQNQGPGFLGLQQPQQPINRFLSASPGLGSPGGLLPQATGFAGRVGGGPLVPQMTGFVDPRLQMMSNTFMPMSNTSFGAPQLAPQQFNLQQSIQQHNEAQRGAPTQQMSWALSKAEKKQYNDIFRSWDAQSTGFISGQTALEVFGASGLPKDDLARIWTLADIDDRGKLNIAEFHVAMGLIYRRLSGMPVPEQLPQELVPPSARDLNSSVDIMIDLLKHESRNRSPSMLDAPVSRAKIRSLNSSSSTPDSSRDATIYKHNDSEPSDNFYKPRSRHINRDNVRSRNDMDSPSADLDEMKRKLADTALMLDRAADADASRTAEDEALDRELEDLKYRVKRVSDDLEYVSRGPRSATKDQDRRKLERELLELMHERVPEVERKIKARDERKEREKRQWARDRDRANERFGRYDSKDDSSSRRYDDQDRDRPYSRGGYRDRDDDHSYRRDTRDRSRDRDRDHERPRSPPRTRSPPPPPSVAPPSAIRDPPAAPAPPRSTPTPAPLKKMTPEERQAFARAEAKRRIEERMAALGVTAPSSSPIIDTSVEDRLQQDKKEAEEKARLAEKQAEERERLRRERLESEKAAKAPPSPPAPTPTRTIPAPAPAPTPRAPPPAPKARAPAPPPPRKAPAIRQAAAVAPPPPAPPPPVVAAPPPEPEVDPEEEAMRAREAAIKKQREARAEKLRQLEREEEEAARLEEEKYQARLQALKARTESPAPPPAPPAPPVAPPPPKAPTPPPASAPADASKSTNPFSRLIKDGATPAATPAATGGSTNPWARPQTAPPPSAPEPPKSPGPKSYNTAPAPSIEDDWDDITENIDDDDSSDDELSGRGQRADLARQLFGSILPTSRPQSAAANPRSSSTPSSPAFPSAPPPPPAPAPPPAPPAPGAPPPPAAPRAPFAPAAPAAGPGDVSDLLRSIQGGLKLRPAKTVDKSGPPVSGRVLGDAAPPDHINAAAPPRAPSPPAVTPSPDSYESQSQYLPEPAAMDQGSSKSSNRQSVGWFSERAADLGAAGEVERLPSMTEQDEQEQDEHVSVPAIQVHEHDAEPDPLADIDRSIEHHVRSLYPYQGEGPGDLSFGENLILTANPSKSGGDWWYGTLVSSGKTGVFPKTYVEVIKSTKAKALYSYTGNNPDELPFTEGDVLTIIDTSEQEWWKTEQGGVVFIVPAAYLEVVEDCTDAAVGVTPTLIQAPPASHAKVRNGTHSQPLHPIVVDPTLENASLDRGESEDEDDSGTESSDYLSFEGSDDDDDYPETKAEREARAHERQLVLEAAFQAAGLIVKQDDKKPPPRPVRRRSTKRRPAPAAPKPRVPAIVTKELPPVPESGLSSQDPEPMDHAARLDDAFDRYQSFKNNQSNRLSVASSVETLSSSPTVSSFSLASAPKEEGGRYSYFLNLLGRTRTPDGEKKTLNISAPIMISEDLSRTSSPAFGTSWASLVDKTALEGIPPAERKRQEAIFELINTEAAYVRDLQLIIETFLSSLEERQKECRLYIDQISDILLSHIPKMGVYMAYCVNQGTAIKVLKSLRDSNPTLAAHLQRLREDPSARNLDLSSYLLAPMQRITRYPLLIKQILNHTENPTERSDIQQAVDVAEKILDHINETIRDMEGRETLRVLSQNLWIGQGRLDLTAPTRHMGPRKLIKEGVLIKAKSGRKLYAFLCSDTMVLTDESMKNLYRMVRIFDLLPLPLAFFKLT
ncbi:hypothetical protein H0H81_002680 [Sphagnurus paluster]|uniref:Actin cytoskeleton-regulatory complex protein PAN1 n=1 Tax=Sphagnurus paluster TaxID=117069 RepID=A0A9P7K6A4_9AGAR|nr:hypothetical protein H0H81_002680 [Sphagnurus paluster]